MSQDTRLPERYLITPSPVPTGDEGAAFLAQLDRVLQAGVRLVQLRAPELDATAYAQLFGQAQGYCRRYNATLLANTSPEHAQILGAQGVHLSSAHLMACRVRPFGPLGAAGYLVSAACHDRLQLLHAAQIGVDFVTLSPVQATLTHPEARAMGWQAFADLVSQVAVPVFALGGMRREDLARVKQAGGYGIAAINSLWNV
jgi:thiamine-phosphate diphosphorylase